MIFQKKNNSYNVFDDPRIWIKPLPKRERDLIIKVCKFKGKNVNDLYNFDFVGEPENKTKNKRKNPSTI